MKSKIILTALCSIALTGCLSFAPKNHQYDPQKSMALNVVEAAEISDKFKDNEPTEEQLSSLSGDIGGAAINTALGFGGAGLGAFGINFLTSSMTSFAEDYNAKFTQLIFAMDTENKSESTLKEEIYIQFIDAIKDEYPETSIVKDSDGYYKIKGGICDKAIEVGIKNSYSYVDRMQKKGCSLLFKDIAILGQADPKIFGGNGELSIVRMIQPSTFLGMYFFSRKLDDVAFYFPSSEVLKRPALVLKNQKVFLFIAPNGKKDISLNPNTILSEYKSI